MTSPRPRPVWRSMLFVPTTSEKFIEKAPTSGSDAIILDLEDAVAPTAKDSARAALPGVAKRLADQGLDVTVRINRPWRLAVKDVEVAVSENIVALLLPMTDTAAHVKEVDQVVSEIEAEKAAQELESPATGTLTEILVQKGEDAKVSIRNIRRKAMEELARIKKDGDAGEDEVTRAEKDLDKTTHQYTAQIDDLVKHKEGELLEV